MAASSQEPLIIRSSARALLGQFCLPVFFLLLVAGLAFYIRSTVPDFSDWLLLIVVVVALGFATRALLILLRIKNTEYAIYPNQVQETSYTFKFMGAKNTTVKLNEIKQMNCFSNGLLDVWFFNCGRIQMVTSGDQVDFILENIHRPMEVKDQLEQRIFGQIASNEDNLRAAPGA